MRAAYLLHDQFASSSARRPGGRRAGVGEPAPVERGRMVPPGSECGSCQGCPALSRGVWPPPRMDGGFACWGGDLGHGGVRGPQSARRSRGLPTPSGTCRACRTRRSHVACPPTARRRRRWRAGTATHRWPGERASLPRLLAAAGRADGELIALCRARLADPADGPFVTAGYGLRVGRDPSGPARPARRGLLPARAVARSGPHRVEPQVGGRPNVHRAHPRGFCRVLGSKGRGQSRLPK